MRYLGIDASGRPDDLEPILLFAVNREVEREYERMDRATNVD